MTIRHFGAMVLTAMAAPALLAAQTNRAPEKDAAHVMVTSFKSSERGEKAIGALAADAMRDKIGSSIAARQVYVIPKEILNTNLIASGFSPFEGLAPHDARQLATMLRGDEYLQGEASRSGTGVKVSADLFLTRDLRLRQPLGTVEAPKVDAAVDALTKEYKEARKQLDGEKKCTNFARNKQYAEAIAAAKGAIALYPKATLARLCLASVLDVSGAPAAEVLAVTREITAVDPKSNLALTLQAKEYKALKQVDSNIVVLTRLLSTDPTNATLANQIVNEIAESTNPKVARPIIDTVVMNNPGDPDLLKTRWLILYAVKDYKEMFAQGEELTKLDTAFTDSTYFARTAVAYANDSQPQKSAETAARALAKFPSNPFFAGLEIQQLQKAGQQQQALDKLEKARAAKIPVENAGALRLILLRDLKQNDKIMAAVRDLVAAGDTSTFVRTILFAQAADDQKTGLAAATSTADTVTVLRNVLATLAYGDSIVAPKSAQKAEAQFRMGGAHVSMAQSLLKLAVAQKSCPLAKEAKDHLVEAQIMLPQGGATYADIMRQLMGSAMQLDQYADQIMAQKGFCK